MPPTAVRVHPGALTVPAGGGALDVASDEEPCVTCGRPAGTPFCPHCGERRAADRALTLRGAGEDVLDALSPADGRGPRSLWLLLRRPGLLTAEYVRGVRQPYLTPLKLFLLVNLAYFAFVAVTHQHMFTTRLGDHVSTSPYTEVARRMVKARLAARGTTWPAYAPRFDAAAETQAKSLLLLTVPGFAGVAAAAQARRRRPALHHLAFALHAVAALLAVLIAGALVVAPLDILLVRAGAELDEQQADLVLSAPYILLWGAWLWAACRRAYGDSRAAAAIKAAALVLGFYAVLVAYRALLFFVTFWTT